MNARRFSLLTAACVTLAASFDGVAGPAPESSASCEAPRLTLLERRVSEQAAQGLPSLVSFVNRTQPIYQVRLLDAVALLDAARERRNACISASARLD